MGFQMIACFYELREKVYLSLLLPVLRGRGSEAAPAEGNWSL
jgi:hypothetical protein